MSSEKFCLRWNDFESNISVAFRELRDDKDFFDVTLACDDDQIQAHKVILSACSPFFRTILRRNRHEHPLLFLKGVKYVDLVSVLNFMYHGEVNVAQEELNSFLAVAEDLKVKGLTQNSSDSKSLPRSTDLPKPRPRDPPDRLIEATPPPKRPRPPPPMPRSAPPPPSSIYHPEEDDIQEVVPVKSEPISHHPDPPNHTHTPAPMAQIEQPYIAPAPQVPQMQHEGVVADPNMEYGEEYGEYEGYEVGMDGSYEGSMLDNSGMGGNDGNKELDMLISGALAKDPVTGEWKCTYCHKTNKNKARITRHVEVHFPGFTQQCPYCEKQLVSRNALRNHVSDVHTKGQRM
eukprot:GFUD01071002.1.p1 GENE.GFUD01071002.1~~GFUD01071002.1.p1  ORF type:complete len:346 (-),score=72.35 GFUD01071002.1:91-1128(-)